MVLECRNMRLNARPGVAAGKIKTAKVHMWGDDVGNVIGILCGASGLGVGWSVYTQRTQDP